MTTNPIVIILLAMAIGLVVGYEVGQHVAKKQFTSAANQLLESIKKQNEEREKRVEEIKKSAAKLQNDFNKLLLNRRERENEAFNLEEALNNHLKETIKKEQNKNEIDSKNDSQANS